MPTITITQTTGADQAKRAAILKAVTAAYAEASGANPTSIWATLTEVERENWAIGGETLAERAAK